MALGWIGSTTAFRCCCQEAVDEMRTGYRLRLGATVAPEFGPDATERRERSVIVEREPDHVFLFGPRVWLRRIFAEAIERHQAPVLGLEPSAPVRRGRIPDVCDRISTGPWWRRHAPAHHNQLDLNGEARTARTNRVARSFRQLRRFHHVIISNKVFGTHEGFRLYRFRIESTVGSRRSSLPHEIGYARRLTFVDYSDRGGHVATLMLAQQPPGARTPLGQSPRLESRMAPPGNVVERRAWYVERRTAEPPRLR